MRKISPDSHTNIFQLTPLKTFFLRWNLNSLIWCCCNYWGSPPGVEAYLLDGNTVESKFVLHVAKAQVLFQFQISMNSSITSHSSRANYFRFGRVWRWKLWIPLPHHVSARWYHYCSCTKTALSFDGIQRLTYHQTIIFHRRTHAQLVGDSNLLVGHQYFGGACLHYLI